MPQAFLICCEGKTEKEYFDILRLRVLRIPMYVRIRIEGEKGQHRSLIDCTSKLRKSIAMNEEIAEEDIECWAVCDDDKMAISFAELSRYAEGKNVNIAFSRPQFESYLIQHFEQSKETDQEALYSALGNHMRALGYEGDYDKADLSWLEKTLIDKPKLLDAAIINANQRTTQSSSPFLTVQHLVERLMELRRL